MIRGRAVRLDSYRLQPINIIEVLGASRSVIVLLVVPPNCDPSNAPAAMTAAAEPNNVLTADRLLNRLGTKPNQLDVYGQDRAHHDAHRWSTSHSNHVDMGVDSDGSSGPKNRRRTTSRADVGHPVENMEPRAAQLILDAKGGAAAQETE